MCRRILRDELEGNFFCCVHARANLRALMTQKSCAVEMRNAILRNHLKHHYLTFMYLSVFAKTCPRLTTVQSQRPEVIQPPVWLGDWPIKHAHGMNIFSEVPCQHRPLEQGQPLSKIHSKIVNIKAI